MFVHPPCPVQIFHCMDSAAIVAPFAQTVSAGEESQLQQVETL